MAVSFTSTLGAVLKVGTKLSEIVNTFNNTLFVKDRVNGDDAEGTGAGGHDHTGSGEGSLLTMAVFDFSESSTEAEDTQNAASWKEVHEHSFTPPEAGDYMIQYNFESTHGAGNGETNVQIDLDDGTILAFTHTEPADADDYELNSGFCVCTVTAAAHTVDIDLWDAAGAGDAKIRRMRVATWRVA